jgi:hypothetical protein
MDEFQRIDHFVSLTRTLVEILPEQRGINLFDSHLHCFYQCSPYVSHL